MPEQKDKLFSSLMIILILVVLAFLVYNFVWDINIFKTKNNETVIQSKTEGYLLSSLPNDPVKGEGLSTIAIYLFTDYEANQMNEIMKIVNDLIKKYPNDVHLVWKDLPVSKHYFSRGAALAARCSLDDQKYWEYNEKLLNRKKSLSLELYQEIASDLGMDSVSFLACYKSGKYLSDIDNNIREAYVLDVDDVPSIFLNQEQLKGEISFEKLDKMVSNLVK
jgi:protein-disulfide isomerase